MNSLSNDITKLRNEDLLQAVDGESDGIHPSVGFAVSMTRHTAQQVYLLPWDWDTMPLLVAIPLPVENSWDHW